MQSESLGRCFADPRGICRGRSSGCINPFAVAAIIVTVCLVIKLSADAISASHINGRTAVRIFGSSSTGAACDETSDNIKSVSVPADLLPEDGWVYSVMRSEAPSVQARSRVSVPQTIWQTARAHNGTPPLGIELFNSWTKLHQDYDHFFLDDVEVQKFVETQYNESVAQAFMEMPLGVMRADAVRYMMLYHYGGVYADMDTECRRPIETWAPRGCHFAVSLENKRHFCQWAFASVAGHGALGSVLDLLIRRMLARDFRLDSEHFVHHVTGPAVFTEGILRYLDLLGAEGELEKLQKSHAKQLKERGICILTAEELKGSLVNLFGSQRQDLQSKTWLSWTGERSAFLEAQKGDDSETTS